MNKYKDQFELCVRAIIQHNGKILVCRNKAKNYYFFPGGHVEFGENTKNALVRELKEELHIVIKKCSFIGVTENIFIEENQKHHELNLVFNVGVEKVQDRSKEDHLDFVFIDAEQFYQEDVLPIALKKTVLKWLKDKKIFWTNQIYDR